MIICANRQYITDTFKINLFLTQNIPLINQLDEPRSPPSPLSHATVRHQWFAVIRVALSTHNNAQFHTYMAVKVQKHTRIRLPFLKSLAEDPLFVNNTKSAKHATSDGCCGSVVDMALISSLVCQKMTLLWYWKMLYNSKAPGVLRVAVCVGLHIYLYISI